MVENISNNDGSGHPKPVLFSGSPGVAAIVGEELKFLRTGISQINSQLAHIIILLQAKLSALQEINDQPNITKTQDAMSQIEKLKIELSGDLILIDTEAVHRDKDTATISEQLEIVRNKSGQIAALVESTIPDTDTPAAFDDKSPESDITRSNQMLKDACDELRNALKRAEAETKVRKLKS